MKKTALTILLFAFTTFIFAQTRGFVKKRIEAKDHIALIIGNSNYPDMPLENPKNDANAVALAFKGMGFITEKVIDADREQMSMAINRFSNKLRTARVAVFYFAGHGMQVDGENYLIPIGRTSGTQIQTEDQVPYRAINAGEVLAAMESNKVKFSLIVLDACRNNPIKGSGRGKLKGLASIDAPAGSLVMYSTKAGDVAADGTGKNSPFTTAFLKHITTPGLDVNLLPSRVTQTVRELTNNQQTPGSYVQITQSFTFVPELTTAELDKIKKQQQGKLTALQIKQAEINRQKDKEDAELARKQAEINALEKQITEMKKQTANGGGDLDKMLIIMKQRKAQKVKLDAMRKKAEEDRIRREKEIYDMKLAKYNEVITKYNKIANEPLMQDMKPAAWNSVLKELGFEKGSVKIGNIGVLKLELLFETKATMLNIKGGTYKMGSNNGESDEKPIHTVTVGNFSISKTEVTNAQYCKFLNAKDNQTEGGEKWISSDRIKGSNRQFYPESGYENHPVVNVTWYGAKAYCEWAGGRLPTEAEWEFAAKAGGNTTYAGSNNIDEVAWYSSNSGSKTHPVGKKQPNAFGLYDMSGNVWEWCSDWYGSDYYGSSPSSNPKGASSGSDRVARGGSWYNYAEYCRSAYRRHNGPAYSNSYVGFRLVRTL